MKIIYTEDMEEFELPFFTNGLYRQFEGKGWSWSYTYHFLELRDIYLALKEYPHKFNLNEFLNHCQNIKLPYVKSPWNSRRILECINALINFELIDSNKKITKNKFLNSSTHQPLSNEDLEDFKEIYFNYFRFKEIFFWFTKLEKNKLNLEIIDNLTAKEIIKDSEPLFHFSSNGRFTDKFITNLENAKTLYYIDKRNGALLRFWDVFIKWGTTLKVIEKFNLNSLGIKASGNRTINCTYVVKDEELRINLLEYITNNFQDRFIHIPNLVLHLIIKFRASINNIHKLIIEQYKIHKEFISFVRTSEIFISKGELNDSETILFLKYDNSYISHIILRQ